MNMPDQNHHVGPRQHAQIEIQDHMDISEIEMITILFRALGFATVMFKVTRPEPMPSQEIPKPQPCEYNYNKAIDADANILNLKPFSLIPWSMSPVESAPPGQCPPDQPTTAADAAQQPVEPDKKIKFREWF